MSVDPSGHPVTRFIADLRFSDVPAPVTEAAALCILDTCAAMVCGAG